MHCAAVIGFLLFTSPDTFHTSPTSVSLCKTLQMRFAKAGWLHRLHLYCLSKTECTPFLSPWMPEKSQASLSEKNRRNCNSIFGFSKIDLSYRNTFTVTAFLDSPILCRVTCPISKYKYNLQIHPEIHLQVHCKSILESPILCRVANWPAGLYIGPSLHYGTKQQQQQLDRLSTTIICNIWKCTKCTVEESHNRLSTTNVLNLQHLKCTVEKSHARLSTKNLSIICNNATAILRSEGTFCANLPRRHLIVFHRRRRPIVCGNQRWTQLRALRCRKGAKMWQVFLQQLLWFNSV